MYRLPFSFFSYTIRSNYYSYNNMTVIDTYSDTVFARDLLADHVRSDGLS